MNTSFFDHISKKYAFPSLQQSVFSLDTTKNAIDKFESWLLNEQNINRQSHKRLMYIFIESVQNMTKHANGLEKIFISIEKKQTKLSTYYYLYFLNEINALNEKKIIREFTQIETLNRNEIKQEIKQRIQSDGKGTGLLSIKQKCDEGPNYYIVEYQSKSFLLLKTGIYV